MFHNHNGHELSQITEIYKNVTTNVTALNAEINSVKKKLEMSQTYLDKSIETVKKMKDKQILVIQEQFNKVLMFLIGKTLETNNPQLFNLHFN